MILVFDPYLDFTYWVRYWIFFMVMQGESVLSFTYWAELFQKSDWVSGSE
jgi:hypothetical protein